MIIIGYQGIGKSSLAKSDKEYIDLESSCFWVDGKRSDTWYIPYTQMAEHLSRQGKIVFTSSHEVVRNQLKSSSEKVICCVPSISLRYDWLDRLKNRYDQTKLEKDYKAYMNAKERYSDNIKEIMTSGFETIVITCVDYNLKDIIEDYISNDELREELKRKRVDFTNTMGSEMDKTRQNILLGKILQCEELLRGSKRYYYEIIGANKDE